MSSAAEQKIIELETIVFILLQAFPNETIQPSHRMRLNEIRLMNDAVSRSKEYVRNHR